MLEGDDAAAAHHQSRSFADERVLQVWDLEAELGALIRSTLGLTDIAWDVYLVYPPGATCDEVTPPEPAFWMHQLSEQYGVGDAPYLDADRLHAEVIRQLQCVDRVPRD